MKKIINTKVIALTLLVTLFAPALQWHSLGHMMVTFIAKKELEKTTIGQKVLKKSYNVLSVLDKWTLVGQDSFVESADWADKATSDGLRILKNFHF